MADPLEGVDPLLAARVKKMIADSGGRLWVTSGFRSVEHQERLWQEALRKYGSEAAARKWVAKPGSSNHNHGKAVDIGGTDEGKAWMAANHGRYGLWQPMEWEPWHMQLPPGVEEEIDPEAFTTPPIGFEPAATPTDPYFQAAQVLGILDSEFAGVMSGDQGVNIAATQAGGIDLSPGGGNVQLPDDPRFADFGFKEAPDMGQDELERMGLDGGQ